MKSRYAVPWYSCAAEPTWSAMNELVSVSDPAVDPWGAGGNARFT
jgi:hypothetical protein